MPNSLDAPLTFYPAYCFSLSPTHNAWVRLFAVDVHTLQERAGFEGQNLYFHLNHPIKWIRLVGVIVALDVYPTRWIMVLDDSSGATIEVTCGRPAPLSSASDPTLISEGRTGQNKELITLNAHTTGVTATDREVDLSGIDVGTVVKARGGIGAFREERQMLLERISIIHTTNEEATAWAEATTFRKGILSIPWVVSEMEEKQARRKAKGLDLERKAREERRKAKQKSEDDRKRRKHMNEDERKRAAVDKERLRRHRERREREEEYGKQEYDKLKKQDRDGEHPRIRNP